MAKPIEKDGELYRVRRGKLVEIPPAWAGKVTSRQTINARQSKLTHKARRQNKRPGCPTRMYREDISRAPIVTEAEE
jgi:hypothetical protein